MQDYTDFFTDPSSGFKTSEKKNNSPQFSEYDNAFINYKNSFNPIEKEKLSAYGTGCTPSECGLKSNTGNGESDMDNNNNFGMISNNLTASEAIGAETPDTVTTSQIGPQMNTTIDTTQERIRQQELAQNLINGLGVPDIADFDVINMPLQQALANNIGEFVVIEFLIGTQEIVKKQGILFNVGVSFVTLFEEETKTFIICDFYSIKFITFYLPGQRPPKNNGSSNNTSVQSSQNNRNNKLRK